jgi:hypothetical protein
MTAPAAAMRRDHRAAGMTLVEITVVLALTLPVLLVLMSATKAVTGSFKATTTSSDEAETSLRVVDCVERVLRAGRRQTLQVQATRTDVTAGRATAVGNWCAMLQRDPRTGIHIDTATGDPGPELVLPTKQHVLTFVPDPRDRADGRDNDGDGLIDEGTLNWTHDGITTAVAKNLELCTFELDGNAIRVRMRFAIQGHGGKLRRTTIEHTVRLNNP